MHKQVAAGVAGLVAGWVTAKATEKSQAVRLADVLLIGPFLFVMAVREEHEESLRLIIAFLAGATVSYNLRNYLNARAASEHQA